VHNQLRLANSPNEIHLNDTKIFFAHDVGVTLTEFIEKIKVLIIVKFSVKNLDREVEQSRPPS